MCCVCVCVCLRAGVFVPVSRDIVRILCECVQVALQISAIPRAKCATRPARRVRMRMHVQRNIRNFTSTATHTIICMAQLSAVWCVCECGCVMVGSCEICSGFVQIRVVYYDFQWLCVCYSGVKVQWIVVVRAVPFSVSVCLCLRVLFVACCVFHALVHLRGYLSPYISTYMHSMELHQNYDYMIMVLVQCVRTNTCTSISVTILQQVLECARKLTTSSV